MVGIRLGKKFFSGSERCPTCSEGNYRNPPLLDPHGHHAMTSAGKTGFVRRHNGLRDLLIAELSKPPICIYPKAEWHFAQDEDLPSMERRRLDFHIDSNNFGARAHGFDVTIISPHSSPYNRTSNQSSSQSLRKAEAAKIAKYGEPCSQEDVVFHPMAMDVYGSLGPGTEKGLLKIAEVIADRKGTTPRHELTVLKLKVSSHVTRMTALALNRRKIGFTT